MRAAGRQGCGCLAGFVATLFVIGLLAMAVLWPTGHVHFAVQPSDHYAGVQVQLLGRTCTAATNLAECQTDR